LLWLRVHRESRWGSSICRDLRGVALGNRRPHFNCHKIMLISPARAVVSAVALLTVAGCRRHLENGASGATRDLCEIHGISLSEVDGYFTDPEVLADPSPDHLRFFGEEQFPHALPWDFTPDRSEIQTQAATVSICPKCDKESRTAFNEFRQLPEAEKNAHEEAMLRRLAEKEKATQGGRGQSATRPESK
jgi:hypothetical protein